MTTKADKQDPVVQNVVTKLQHEGRKVHIVGRIKDGKIEFDPADLAEAASKNPHMVFLALNSPFDPVPYHPE
jgi:hypothetical protein